MVSSCSQLAAGDRIEVRRDNRIIHQGEVRAIIAHLNLVWITDTVTGARQLLDLELLHVLGCRVRAVAASMEAAPQPAKGMHYP
jgi:hypothetical protein